MQGVYFLNGNLFVYLFSQVVDFTYCISKSHYINIQTTELLQDPKKKFNLSKVQVEKN